jgi:catechol 2,3-dioxygenase-like lactoylglutathione lyase family enzyme
MSPEELEQRFAGIEERLSRMEGRIARSAGAPPPRPAAAPPRGPSQQPGAAHNVSSKAEVKAVIEEARRAGAVVVKPPEDTFWVGYSGYFQDPDGHLWEVAWNPHWVMPD